MSHAALWRTAFEREGSVIARLRSGPAAPCVAVAVNDTWGAGRRGRLLRRMGGKVGGAGW